MVGRALTVLVEVVVEVGLALELPHQIGGEHVAEVSFLGGSGWVWFLFKDRWKVLIIRRQYSPGGPETSQNGVHVREILLDYFHIAKHNGAQDYL